MSFPIQMRRSYPQAASDKQGRGATPRTWARRPAPGPQPPSRPILPIQHSGTTLRTQRCLPLTPKGRGPTWEPRPRAKNRSGEGQRLARVYARRKCRLRLTMTAYPKRACLRVRARAEGERDSRETCRSGNPGVAELCRESRCGGCYRCCADETGEWIHR